MAGDGQEAADRPELPPLRIDNILHGGEVGRFCANAELIGWQSADKGRSVIHPIEAVRRAAWLEGQLQYLCSAGAGEGGGDDAAGDGGDPEVVALEGFAPGSFDLLWRHFERHCGVYLQRKRPVATLSEDDFDGAMRGIEEAADRVDEASSGGVQKKAREADLMKKVESVRDGLELLLGGDRVALSRVFAANGCERIGRMRLVVATVDLEVYRQDARWEHLRRMALTIEGVLQDLGTFRVWKPSEDDVSMARRQVVWELIVKRGGDPTGLGSLQSPDGAEAFDPSSGAEYAAGGLQGAPALHGCTGLSATARAAAEAAAAGGLRGLMPQSPQPPRHAEDGPVVAADEDGGSGDGLADALAGSGGEDEDGCDEEVMDPNQHKASALDQRLGAQAAGGAAAEGKARARYIFQDSLLEGWVWKRSRYMRRWRRRYCVLDSARLRSFKPGRAGPLTSAPPTEILEAGVVEHIYSADGEVQQARAFAIVVPRRLGRKRVYYMVCDFASQKEEWIRMVSQTLTGGGR